MTSLKALESWGSFDLDDPFPLFAEVRQLGPVHPVTLSDGHAAWLIVRYDEAMAALNDQRLSKDMHAALALGDGVVAEGLPGPEFAMHMLTVDPPDHTRLRRLVSAAFSPRRVESTEYEAAKSASDSVVGRLRALVRDKREAPDQALVSALISARDGTDQLTSQELLSTIFQLIVAGHDTTASLIENSVVALLRNPEQLAELQRDTDKVPAAVEEFLRYDAPVPHSTFRYTVEPVVIGGVEIPAGAQIIICLAAANRDGDRFTSPEELDIDRAVARHLAFGHGVHHCLGAPLARMEGQIALSTLLRRFPDLGLAVGPEALHWAHGDGLVLRGLSELPVIPGRSLPPAAAAESSQEVRLP